ncbi:MAG: hypothetical protein ACR2PS_09335 [Pseudomonadales bacterium]
MTYLFAPSSERKAVSPLNASHPETGGIVGNPMDKHGTPYALTEEFVEVYRLHSLLPEALRIKKMGDSESTAVEDIPLDKTRIRHRQVSGAAYTPSMEIKNE